MKNTEKVHQAWNRRQFIGRSILGSLAATITAPYLHSCTNFFTEDQTVDWDSVRAQFPIIHWDHIYCNSGSAGVMPSPVLEYVLDLVRQMNSIPPYEAWKHWTATRNKNLSRLAAMLNVHTTEVQLVRNTTEALNMIIYGLPLKAGDHILYSKHDYPFAKNAWQNRASRDGIELIAVDFKLPDSDESILAAYQRAMTPQVKIIHCTHITHAQGHIMPIAALARLAHQNGAEVVVDGAHSVGQIPVDLAMINCDYFATSLHKWLNAPHGTGLLFVKEPLIGNLYNHPSSYSETFDKIDKFEQVGTRAFQQEIGVSAALDFHEQLGSRAKYERLQVLKTYWTSKLQDLENVIFYTDFNQENSAAIVTFRIKNQPIRNCLKQLSETYRIHAKSVGGDWGGGIRISVNIFTSFDDLDQLVAAIRTMAQA